ncbi:prenyltransferase/squalene oxidase repeat-containing protein [soil metagenome]
MSLALPATLRRTLLERRVPDGHWEGRLSSSALATATAVTALAAAGHATAAPVSDRALVENGVRWLVASRNDDGGWGDTRDSVSNVSTTALCWAALASGRGPDVERAAGAAEAWITRAAGGADPARLAAAVAARYGKDRTFSVPILTMCAIAGRLGTGAEAWRVIPQLPFELALFPRRLFGFLRLPVVSYALPALISMGLARHSRGPRGPLLGRLRERARRRVLEVLDGLQPAGGGFLEAIPLTSFVAMSLIAAGEAGHPVVARGLEFLRRSVRADGSWAVDSNLATWVTTLSLDALAAGDSIAEMNPADRRCLRDWLLGQQWRVEHPYTGAAPGGWAWTDLPGGVPDADDTAGALVALAIVGSGEPQVREAALLGVGWLVDLQNRDGGIPTFCRGWGALPFDRSSSDLTAHALRAWALWYPQLDIALQRRADRAIRRAVGFLSRSQRADGAFIPLWFGNQAERGEENPVFGTGRVLKGLSAIADRDTAAVHAMARRAAAWLVSTQNADGGWGAGEAVRSSIEETAVAVSGLACLPKGLRSKAIDATIERGLAWIAAATDEGTRFPASPLGLYFARLWYSEDLYPLIFAAGAAGTASTPLRRTVPPGAEPSG